MKKLSIIELLANLWQHVSVRRRYQLCGLLALMVLTSLAEIISIGLVLPFLGILASPELFFEGLRGWLPLSPLGINSPAGLIFPLTAIFCAAIIWAGIMRLLLLFASSRLSFSIGADLSNEIYRRTLYQPYSVHISRNSSEIISAVSTKANDVIYGVIVPTLSIASSFFLLIFILTAVLIFNPVIALSTFAGFGLVYIFIIIISKRQLKENSQSISFESTRVIKSLQEGLGGIRDILIDGSQSLYSDNYRVADKQLRKAQGSNLFIGQSPRFSIEALGMLLIVVIAYFLATKPEGLVMAIPTLGVLALASQRMLPLLQLIYGSWAAINSSQASLQDVLVLLNQPLPKYEELIKAPIAFRESISLANVSFRYSNSMPWAFENLNLTIRKGDRLGIVGRTGGGKSTMLDLIMGLLDPTSGFLLIDGVEIVENNRRNWQAHIAHVPQFIYLADATIAENIAFGVPVENIDFKRVESAASQARILEMIQNLPKGFETLVGERGIQLSGGQRQRIGIARALYKQADVIIFDEATSSLDVDTEMSIMDAIDKLGSSLTILIVAHRITTLKNCNQILELDVAGDSRLCEYEDLQGGLQC
jgi:ATP-binding cassette subfamily B protein